MNFRIALLYLFMGMSPFCLYCQTGIAGFTPSDSEWELKGRFSKDEIDEVYLFINSDGIPTILLNNQIININDYFFQGEPLIAKLPGDVLAEQIVCLNTGEVVAKDKDEIRLLSDSAFVLLLKMPDSKFYIYPAANSKFYILKPNVKSGSDIFLLDINSLESAKLFSSEFIIDEICGDGAYTYAVSGNKIYYLSPDGSSIVCINDTPVNSISHNEEGVFYSSDSGVYYISSPGVAYPFYLEPSQKVLSYNDVLYVLDQNGFFFTINNTYGFEDIVEEAYKDMFPKD